MVTLCKQGLAGLTLMMLVMVVPATAEIEVSGNAYIGVSSMYLWRGIDLSNGDPVAQAGMDIGFKGLTIGFWTNYRIEDTKLDETDITIDYGFDVTDMLSVNLGHILYAVDGYETTGELYGGVTFNTLLEPNLTLYYDYDEFAGDIFVTASVGHSLALADGLDLSLGALASYYRNDDYKELHNGEFSLGLDYGVTDQLSISAVGLYSTPLSSKARDAIDDEFMAGLSLNLSF